MPALAWVAGGIIVLLGGGSLLGRHLRRIATRYPLVEEVLDSDEER